MCIKKELDHYLHYAHCAKLFETVCEMERQKSNIIGSQAFHFRMPIFSAIQFGSVQAGSVGISQDCNRATVNARDLSKAFRHGLLATNRDKQLITH